MLNTLRQIVQEVTSAQDLPEALKLIVTRVREAIAVQVCSIYLFDQDSQRYVLMATEGLNKAEIGLVSLGANEGIIALVGKREEPLNIEDAPNHPAFHYLPSIGEEDFNAFLAAPIIHRRRLLGVITAQRHAKGRFDESEEAFLVTVSAQLAGLIAHAELSGLALKKLTGIATRMDVRFSGLPGAQGVAIGTAVMVVDSIKLSDIPHRTITDVVFESNRFQQALAAVKLDIRSAGDKLEQQLSANDHSIFDVYISMLDDQTLSNAVLELIAGGEWAEGALAQVTRRYARQFAAIEDEYLRDRVTDIRDLGRRILAKLQSDQPARKPLPERTILVGDDLTPTLLAEVDASKLCGIVATHGSANSHIAILARAMGIPTVMGVSDLPLQQIENETVIIDGYRGLVFVGASEQLLSHYQTLVAEEETFAAELETLRDEPSITLDGHLMNLQVNTGLLADVFRAAGRGAEGVGLYRSEVAFMVRERFPTEAEQTEIYRQQLEAFAPYPVAMRTLDIGGDKALPYFSIEEENPFLGWRGIRVTLDHPEIFLVQVRAMLRASLGLDNLGILLPMISQVDELDQSIHLIYRALFELREEGMNVAMPKVGMMIEVPATVYQTATFARRVDFLSVGSNDLTQYLLAVDRNNVRVADLFSNYHPAVLQALQEIFRAANSVGTPVSVCGEMAGEPAGALLLAAMGYTTLSMNSASLLSIKSMFREITLSWAQQVLAQAMTYDDPNVVLQSVEDALHAQGVTVLKRSMHSEPSWVV